MHPQGVPVLAAAGFHTPVSGLTVAPDPLDPSQLQLQLRDELGRPVAEIDLSRTDVAAAVAGIAVTDGTLRLHRVDEVLHLTRPGLMLQLPAAAFAQAVDALRGTAATLPAPATGPEGRPEAPGVAGAARQALVVPVAALVLLPFLLAAFLLDVGGPTLKFILVVAGLALCGGVASYQRGRLRERARRQQPPAARLRGHDRDVG